MAAASVLGGDPIQPKSTVAWSVSHAMAFMGVANAPYLSWNFEVRHTKIQILAVYIDCEKLTVEYIDRDLFTAGFSYGLNDTVVPGKGFLDVCCDDHVWANPRRTRLIGRSRTASEALRRTDRARSSSGRRN